MDESSAADEFFNQLLLVTSLENANALIDASREHVTRLFLRRVFEAARLERQASAEQARAMLNVLHYAVNRIADPLVLGDELALRAEWERQNEQSDRFLYLYAAALETYQRVPTQASPEIALCLFNLGLACFQSADFARAGTYLDQAIAHDLASQLIPQAIDALHLRGRIADVQGNLDDARAYFARALKLAEEHGLEANVLSERNSLAILDFKRGDLDSARTQFEQTLERARTQNAQMVEALATGNLGLIALARANLDRAETWFSEARTLHTALGNVEGEATSQGNLGLVAARRGDHRRAIELFQDALARMRDAKNPAGIALYLSNLGDSHAHLSELTHTEEYFRQALSLAEQIKSHRSSESAQRIR